MPCKTSKKGKHGRPVAKPMSSNQNLRVFWKLVDLQDCVWENHCRFIMKLIQEKETIHHSIIIWCTNLLLCLEPWKFQQQRQQWTRNGKIWRKFSAWNLTKVRSKTEVIDEARTSGATVHFASLMDICHLRNAELEAKHQKYKGRDVLWGDIVKDDSGSYAVSIDQHHKWEQQKSWISYPDCQAAHDKQLTQYLLRLR